MWDLNLFTLDHWLSIYFSNGKSKFPSILESNILHLLVLLLMIKKILLLDVSTAPSIMLRV